MPQQLFGGRCGSVAALRFHGESHIKAALFRNADEGTLAVIAGEHMIDNGTAFVYDPVGSNTLFGKPFYDSSAGITVHFFFA